MRSAVSETRYVQTADGVDLAFEGENFIPFYGRDSIVTAIRQFMDGRSE